MEAATIGQQRDDEPVSHRFSRQAYHQYREAVFGRAPDYSEPFYNQSSPLRQARLWLELSFRATRNTYHNIKRSEGLSNAVINAIFQTESPQRSSFDVLLYTEFEKVKANYNERALTPKPVWVPRPVPAIFQEDNPRYLG